MLRCLLFGLLILLIMFLVPQGAKLFPSVRQKACYKFTLLVGYMGELVWVTLFSRLGRNVVCTRFQPFHVIRQMLRCWFGGPHISAARCRAIFRNSAHLLDGSHATPVEDLCLNIILFIPFGFLLPYLWPKLNFYKTVLLSLIFSVLIEGFQYIAHLGCCDIDDVINDTLGTCIGYGCFVIYKKIAKK